jgi:hypothetical protein
MTTPDVMQGANFPLNSFKNHEFEVREVPAISTGACKSEDQVCRSTSFVVSPGEEQTFTITKDFVIDFIDDKVKAEVQATEIVQTCQKKAKAKLAAADNDATMVHSAMDDLVACVEGGVAEALKKANEELAFQSLIRKGMANQMENYTCVDLSLNTTPSLEDKIWKSDKDGKRRKVQVLLDRPASRIHVIENFISEEECKAMALSAEPNLHQATVADGKGGSHFSEHRKGTHTILLLLSRLCWRHPGPFLT